ncbi:serine/threonine-protein kinase [Streptomyces sp. NPDC049954]|uniref:serine/threonine-protein kinase n=1 Tax=Streptomyces sp. NPDC049954 TaxID=3155779 RepID=UPI00341A310B
MTNHGGPYEGPTEPTSYQLRPPRPAEEHSAPYVPGPAAAPAAVPGEPQRRVGGRYRLLSRLGHGGMGTVWRAHDEIVDREVAVKEPRLPEHLSEAERQTAYLRMQREARAAARIDHPSVVTVHDVVEEEGRPWVVMELVRGQSLGDRLGEGTLDPREAARIGLDVAGALEAAHQRGVLHRDVKPDNVLLSPEGRVVLTDFGIAQIEGEAQLTETGAFIGSPEYIAPERVLGQRPGPASDLWSLGVVLYAAVEGMSPYRRSHTPATLQAVLSAEPQPPARAQGPLATLVMQLLRKDPAARPSAAEVRQQLAAVTAVPLAPTRPLHEPSAAGGGNRWVPPVLHRNRPAQWGLGGGVLVLAVALVLLLVNPFAQEDPMPAGWQVRPESEVLHADLAVPEDYRRVAGSDGQSVQYYDPSGVFTISLARVDLAEDTEKPQRRTREEWKTFYETDTPTGAGLNEPRVTQTGAAYAGAKEVFDNLVEYDGPPSGNNQIRKLLHERVVNDPKDAKVYWSVALELPAKGAAREDGDRLFEDVARNFRIKDW